jgi:hypothetical protein
MKKAVILSILILTALASRAQNYSTIAGFVCDKYSTAPIPAVHVLLFKDGAKIGAYMTDSTGYYRTNLLEEGNYEIAVYLRGYAPIAYQVKTGNPDPLLQNFPIDDGKPNKETQPQKPEIFISTYSEKVPGPKTVLKGRIKDSSTGENVFGAQVLLLKDGIRKAGEVTGLDGKYEIDSVPYGDYTIRVNYTGYPWQQREVSLRTEEACYNFTMFTDTTAIIDRGWEYFRKEEDLDTDNPSTGAHIPQDIIRRTP